MLENIIKITSKYRENVRAIIICLISAFLLAVSAQISIPLPGGVPMTLQTFALAFFGYTLSKKCGIGAVITYLLFGVVGVPVFTGSNFGTSAVFGITGGFLIGFVFLVWFCNKAKNSKYIVLKIGLSAIGIMICHLLGVLQYSFLTGLNLLQAFLLVSLPFLLKDSFSVILAYMISNKIQYRINSKK